MHRTLSLAAVFAASFAFACTSSPGPDGPAGPLGNAISGSLHRAGLAAVSAHGAALEHDLMEPLSAEINGDVDAQTCGAIGAALQDACFRVTDGSLASLASCWPQATFFFANKVPRCAVRVTAWDSEQDVIPVTWAFDFSGEPYDGAAPTCGNGELEPGEQCDDGNNESWDGCDPNCLTEQFTGCEAVIEYHYKLQQIAIVDQNLWDGPRSHLMINTQAVPMREVSQATCNDALAAGTDVCNQLTTTMPFVSWCGPQVEYFTDELGPACAVQLQVGFQTVDPDNGVFTTALPGILAFTIR